jgi:uncharacterized protein YjiS (DUF1127 family)
MSTVQFVIARLPGAAALTLAVTREVTRLAQAVHASAARGLEHIRRRRRQRAYFMAMHQLSDATLRDLGLHRSEIGSAVAEAMGQAEPTRRRIVRER